MCKNLFQMRFRNINRIRTVHSKKKNINFSKMNRKNPSNTKCKINKPSKKMKIVIRTVTNNNIVITIIIFAWNNIKSRKKSVMIQWLCMSMKPLTCHKEENPFKKIWYYYLFGSSIKVLSPLHGLFFYIKEAPRIFLLALFLYAIVSLYF